MGENASGLTMSPKYGGHIELFNSFGKIDLYNQIGYRSNCDFYGVNIDPTYDYTASESYAGLPYSMPIFDRKFWVNLEYLF